MREGVEAGHAKVEGGIRRVLEDDMSLKEKLERRVCQSFGVGQREVSRGGVLAAKRK